MTLASEFDPALPGFLTHFEVEGIDKFERKYGVILYREKTEL
jgi:hypothetical protein